MNKEFIPYEQALELKELGFDEKCLSLYLDNDKKTMTSSVKGADTNSWLKEHYSGYRNSITAPLYQQAFRWFREKYRLYPEIIYSARDKKWVCQTSDCIGFELLGWYQTYEEAELECLKKLIEIAKDKPQKQGRIQDISIG
jgi:hypothetical protein